MAVPGDTLTDDPVLRLTGITKQFGALRANDGISLSLARGEVVALLGENGAGKTTLMNILFGHYVADAGSVEAFGKPLPPGDPRAALSAGIGMVHQHFTLAGQMSVLDNIALGTQPLFSPRFDKAGAKAKILKLAGDFGLQVNPDALVQSLSVGERQRVEILKALYRDARILILDEPTAVLTPQETDALFATLKKLVADGLSIIFISHKLHEVMAVADRVVVLRAGRVAGEVDVADTDRHQLATMMVGQEIAPPDIAPPVPGPSLLTLRNVHAAGQGGGPAITGVDLDLRGGEITGLAGVSGNGQAALAALIAGTARPIAGDVIVKGEAVSGWSPRAALSHGIGRIPEDRHATGMIDDMSVAENVISEAYRSRRFSRFGFLDWSAARTFAERIIADYDVKCPSPEARVRLLSGGNMQKLILGRALDGEPAVILANQPTRGLDVGAVSYVHERLLEARARGAAVLLISEDLDEVLALADRVIVMSKGRLSAPSARGERSLAEIGQLMAGHGFAEASHAA
ncbi:MAG: sugar ABC transporter ATP-binding protein [Phyllobacteriaceae bacterium]|nr:sugar ABC transporter ATP-binding protein [Phyllobacteriaceae bacterium]MBA91501.1 sugar ABC transporter ATP-binding protein [Phyllobacteriaceae bacterium]